MGENVWTFSPRFLKQWDVRQERNHMLHGFSLSSLSWCVIVGNGRYPHGRKQQICSPSLLRWQLNLGQKKKRKKFLSPGRFVLSSHGSGESEKTRSCRGSTMFGWQNRSDVHKRQGCLMTTRCLYICRHRHPPKHPTPRPATHTFSICSPSHTNIHMTIRVSLLELHGNKMRMSQLTFLPLGARFPIFFQVIAFLTFTPVAPRRVDADVRTSTHVLLCTFINVYTGFSESRDIREWKGVIKRSHILTSNKLKSA